LTNPNAQFASKVVHARARTARVKRLTSLAFTWMPVVAEDLRGLHGHGHDAFHHWCKTLRQPGTGFSCCNDRDCRQQSRTRGANIEVMVDGEWADKILDRVAPDLNSHVCSAKGPPWQPKIIFCVVLGLDV
jgi:hypothetical protein